MKVKLLMTLFIMLSLMVAGCVDDTETTTTEENESVNDSVTDTVNESITEETEVAPVNESIPEETVSEDEEDENGELEIIEYEGPKSYTIYMRNFNVQPHNLTINEGDSVIWYNDNGYADSSKIRTFTLVSNDGLWENVSVLNKKNFIYTFNESGTYSYRVLTWEVMKGTIIVK